jgi:predicted nucleotide-binding protein (sugar kinase/HSP70/actin superfamily)
VIPDDSDYFEGMSAEFSAKLWMGFAVHDLLEMMLLDVRPVERRRGAANAIHQRYVAELHRCMEQPPTGRALTIALELVGGMWGGRRIIEQAAKEYAELKRRDREVPTVGVVGEIYVRLDPFANDSLVHKLEERGLRVRFAPFIEWLEYSVYLAAQRVKKGTLCSTDDALNISVTGLVQRATLDTLYPICARALGWGPRLTVEQTVEAAKPYVHPGLKGEAQLTVGGPVYEFQHGQIQGVVVVGPHECMPCKIAEAQYGFAAERLGIPYLSISVNGDPVDTDILDRFAYDIRQLKRQRPRAERSLPLVPGPESERPSGVSPEGEGIPTRRPFAQA